VVGAVTGAANDDCAKRKNPAMQIRLLLRILWFNIRLIGLNRCRQIRGALKRYLQKVRGNRFASLRTADWAVIVA
jgi:hypothetical protein